MLFSCIVKKDAAASPYFQALTIYFLFLTYFDQSKAGRTECGIKRQIDNLDKDNVSLTERVDKIKTENEKTEREMRNNLKNTEDEILYLKSRIEELEEKPESVKPYAFKSP